MNEFLTTQEAAEELGVTDSRVRQLILDGKLPARKFGRSHVIKRSDLKNVVVGNRGRPPKNSMSDKEGKAIKPPKKVK